MKNRYLKGAHISEKKVRELLRLFCDDLTATQIANISGVSRITVNAYLKLIRTHIAKFVEEKNPVLRKNGNFLFLSSPVNNANYVHTNNTLVKKSLYGVFKHSDIIYTDKINNIDYNWLFDWLKGKITADPAKIEQYHLNLSSGIMDFNSIKLFRINNGSPIYSKTRLQPDEIDHFWAMLKSRLVKFRGLNTTTLFLHVKETEFRYNNRHNDLFELLSNIIYHHPLHFSKAEKA